MSPRLKQKLVRSAKIAGIAVGGVLAVLLTALGAVFVFTDPPVEPFEPVTWRPGAGSAVDPAKIRQPEAILPFINQELKGPEDVVVDQKGTVYTGTSDGKIMHIVDGQGIAKIFAEVGGRPLGLAFDKNQNLLVANQGIGLQSVSPEGKVTLLTNHAAAKPILFANDLAVADNGIIFFSDSNYKYNPSTLGNLPSFSLYDFLEGRAQGRLLQFDPTTGEATEVLSNLYFPNGVAVTSDQRAVLVAESTRYRITRYWLKGEKAGTSDIFLNKVPGILDGFTRTADGRFLLPVYERSAALDNVILPSTFARQLLVRLPWLAEFGSPPAGSILVLSQNGELLRQIEGIRPSPSNVAEYDNQWFLGSLSNTPIRTLPRPHL